ncbi:hypothetical protein BD770DRAFT_378896 [Pilaira anomala]|nr:hypothetical protein BD770DRAFT_378896 [Pilaira anomala]
MTLTNKEQKIIDTHREILWLKRQIEEYEDEDKIELPEVSEETEENIKNGIDMYSNHINSMRVQIEIATLRNKNQEAILKALFERCFLRNALFSDKEVKKYINQRDKFVNKFMALYLTLKENTSELTKLQMESMQLHTENQERSRKVLELKREIDDIIMTGNTKGLHQS